MFHSMNSIRLHLNMVLSYFPSVPGEKNPTISQCESRQAEQEPNWQDAK